VTSAAVGRCARSGIKIVRSNHTFQFRRCCCFIFSLRVFCIFVLPFPGVCRPFRRVPKLLTTLSSGGRAVWGVAWLDGRIYVVSADSNQLTVYRGDSPFDCVDNIVVEGSGKLWDMVACSTNRCLFVTDYTNGCVWHIACPQQTITRSVGSLVGQV
jgi:hypothetical protein